jgi:MFS family permease
MTRVSRPPVLSQLSGAPRFWLLMFVTLPTAGSLSAKEVARLEYVTDTFGGPEGIGSVGAILAVSAALGGAIAGPLIDRLNPSRVLVANIAAIAAANLAAWWLLTRGPMAEAQVLAVAFVDGVLFGVGVPALVKVQSALVPTDARGSAEIVNALRASIGAIAGLVLASVSPSPSVTLLGCALAVAAVGGAVAFVVLPGPQGPTQRALRAAGSMWAALQALPTLRRVVIVDLLLAFALPTQVSNLVLVEEGETVLLLPVLLAGVLGVLMGRLLLLVTGALTRVRRHLLLAFGVFVAAGLAGIPLTATGVVVASPALAGGFILVASTSTAYVWGMVGALVQQQVPDGIRGSLTGFLVAARSLLAAGAATLITVTVVAFSSTEVIIAVCALALIALALAQGFRGMVPDQSPART